MHSHYIKMVIIGDGSIGKTSLLISFASGSFPHDYQPTVFDNFSAHQVYEGKAFNLGLWDTAGQEDFDRLRPLGYNNTDVFLICYSVINPPSYSNVFDKWYSEINQYTCNIPIVLIGTQIDLRTDQQTLETLSVKQQVPLTFEDGLIMKKRIGANAFTECSVQNMKGVKQVFDEAIKVYIESQTIDRKKKKIAGTRRTSITKKSISNTPTKRSSKSLTSSNGSSTESTNCVLL